MRRIACLLTLLLTFAVAGPAFAQSDPFAPIPAPNVPAPTPETTPVPTVEPSDDNQNTGPADEPTQTVLLVVAGAVALIFLAIGVYITRDARKNLTDADRRAVEREREGMIGDTELTPEQRKEQRRQKEKARKKSKAQKQARKVQRKR